MRIISSAVIASTIIITAAGHAGAVESEVCQSLTRDYENVFKNMAATFAGSIGDDSAVRETVREIQNGNDLMRAQLLLDLMKGNGCTIPKTAPMAGRYLTSALTCSTAKLKGNSEEFKRACDRSQWQADKGAR